MLFRIALRSVRKNWRHSAGAMLAVAVGFSAITLFDGYLSDFEHRLRVVVAQRFMMGTVVIEGTGTSAAMSRKRDAMVYLHEPEQAFVDEYLRAHGSEVAIRVRSLFVGGVVSNGEASTPFVGWGYDPVEGAAMRGPYAWDARNGRPLHQAGGEPVLLARGLAGLLECAPTDSEPPFGPDGLPIEKDRPFACRRPRVQLIGATATGQVNAVDSPVAGIMDAGRKEMDVLMVAMPLALAQRFRNARDVSQYNVLLRDSATADRFARDLMAAAAARGFAIDAMPWEAGYFGEQFRQGMGIIRTLRSFMAVVVVAISGMAVFTTMVKVVSERTREIGTLRSLGFLRRQVMALFAIEAALLAAVACAAGLLVTLAVAALVNRAGVTYTGGVLASPIPLGVATEPLTHLRAAAFLIGVAVCAAWLPARRAARRRIPDALAYA